MTLLGNNKTLLYITWDISRDFLIYSYVRSSYNESWIVRDARLTLKKVFEEKRYGVYEIHKLNQFPPS